MEPEVPATHATEVPRSAVSVTPKAEAWNAGRFPLIFLVFGGLVFCVQVARILWSYCYLRSLKRTGIVPPPDLKLNFDEWVIGCAVRRPVRLLLSDRVKSPIAVGFRHPAVIIPRSMVGHFATDDIDHLLLHELAHLARRDDWTNLAARLAWGLVLFFPVAAWVLRKIDEEREMACDDWVVSTTGAAKSYAISLSRLLEFRLARPCELLATGIGGRDSQFGNRIERLLRATRFDNKASAGRIAMTSLVLVVLLVAGTQVPSWVAFAQQEPPAPALPSEVPSPAAVPEPPPAPPSKAPRSVPSAPPAMAAAPAAVPASRPVPVLDVPPAPQPPQPQQPVLAAMSMQAGRVQPPAAPVAPAAPVKAASGAPSFCRPWPDAGYRDLSVEEIIELKNNGISAQFLGAMNQADGAALRHGNSSNCVITASTLSI